MATSNSQVKKNQRTNLVCIWYFQGTATYVSNKKINYVVCVIG